jgi:hypothetical protein
VGSKAGIAQDSGREAGRETGARVAVVALSDDAFVEDLRRTGATIAARAGAALNDIIFFGVDTPSDLERFKSLQKSLAPDGALWSIRPKGRPEVSESIVMAAGKAAGLVDVKVAKFSDTHTAEKLRPSEAPPLIRCRTRQRRSSSASISGSIRQSRARLVGGASQTVFTTR